MDSTWLRELQPAADAPVLLAKVNAALAAGGLAISERDAQMLAKRRVEALAATELVEFGPPAVVTVAEAVATSPCFSPGNAAADLAQLQEAFYIIRDELPPDVPDAEIADALRGCLDAWGDAAEVAAMAPEEVMRFSDAYAQAAEAERADGYRIADDEGREYAFDQREWEYDEQAGGWDGERWSDDGDD